jgi:hypothetical protein
MLNQESRGSYRCAVIGGLILLVSSLHRPHAAHPHGTLQKLYGARETEAPISSILGVAWSVGKTVDPRMWSVGRASAAAGSARAAREEDA